MKKPCVFCAPPKGASDTVLFAGSWLADVAGLLYEKNRKYGDSAARPLRVFSRATAVEQLLVRLDDKLSRVAKGAGLLATDEDVIRDLVGYLALLAALLEETHARKRFARPLPKKKKRIRSRVGR